MKGRGKERGSLPFNPNEMIIFHLDKQRAIQKQDECVLV